MRCFSIGFSLLILSCAIAAAQTPLQRPAPRALTPEILNHCQQTYAGLQPSVRDWVHTQARSAIARHTLNVSELRTSVLQRFPTLRTGQPGDVMAMLVMLLTETIQQTNEDKNYYLQKLADINTISQQISNQIAQLAQATQNQAQAGPHSKSDTDDPCSTPYCSSLSVRLSNLNAASAHLPHPLHLQAPAKPTYRDLQRLRVDLQVQSNSLGDESQMLRAQLQKAEQDYEQAVSTISGILKQTNDTAMSTIKNLK